MSVVADGTNTIRNSYATTGNQEKDFMKNVFDLYGCHIEWTLEANSTNRRVSRGGYSRGSNAPSSRYNNYPSGTNSNYSARLTLYIK